MELFLYTLLFTYRFVIQQQKNLPNFQKRNVFCFSFLNIDNENLYATHGIVET